MEPVLVVWSVWQVASNQFMVAMAEARREAPRQHRMKEPKMKYFFCARDLVLAILKRRRGGEKLGGEMWLEIEGCFVDDEKGELFFSDLFRFILFLFS